MNRIHIATARDRSRAVSRQRLLDAAAEIFAERGFTNTKASDIASRAGLAVGTLYLHFRDKDEIGRAVAIEALTELRLRLRTAVETTHSTVAKAAQAHATALVDFVSDASARGRLLFAVDAPGLRNDVLDAMAAAQKAHLIERQRDGYFRADIDADVAAQALVGMQSRTLMWWLENPARASREAIIDTLAKLRASGIHDGGNTPAPTRRRRARQPSRSAGRPTKLRTSK